MLSITYKYQKMLFGKTHQKIFSLFSQKKIKNREKNSSAKITKYSQTPRFAEPPQSAESAICRFCFEWK